MNSMPYPEYNWVLFKMVRNSSTSTDSGRPVTAHSALLLHHWDRIGLDRERNIWDSRTRIPTTDRLGKTDEKKSEFRLQYTYYISIESSQRALS
eukprot:COSAG02_NODE_1961_length_10255_cov_5.103771_1_plen_93_part_10